MDNDPFPLYLSSLGDALEDLNLTTYRNQLEKKQQVKKLPDPLFFFLTE